MRETAEHGCSGEYLLHQNSIPNEWFERGGYLSLKFLLSSGDVLDLESARPIRQQWSLDDVR